MLLRLIRFAKGYVLFRAVGRTPERLLNLAAQRGILLWNARPAAKGMEAFVSVADYRRLRVCARRAGVRTKILRKHGAPFWAVRYRGRFGIPAGAVLGAALLVILSQFVWTIHVKNTAHVSEARLRGLLAESGVKTGVLRHGIDAAQVRRDILLEVEELSWLSVNILGSHVNVEVKEKTPKPELEPNALPCNLKASADGVITDMVIGEGITQVKKGSGVRKGDLLVSGIQLTTQNNVRYVSAKGTVMADVLSEKKFSVPKEVTHTQVTENASERFCLDFMGVRIPCSFSLTHFDNAVCSESTSWLTVNNVALPVGTVTETMRGVQTEQAALSKGEAKQLLEKEEMLWELFENGEGKRVTKQTEITETADGYICHAHCVFNRNIAESVDFTVE